MCFYLKYILTLDLTISQNESKFWIQIKNTRQNVGISMQFTSILQKLRYERE